MKFQKLILLCLLICFTLVLFGCGYDTRDWPRLSLPFEDSQLIKVTINFDKQPYGKDPEPENDSLNVEQENILANIYNLVSGFPFQEKQKNTSIQKNIGSRLK